MEAGVLRVAPKFSDFPLEYAKSVIRDQVFRRWESVYVGLSQDSGIQKFCDCLSRAFGWSYNLTQALTGFIFSKSIIPGSVRLLN